MEFRKLHDDSMDRQFHATCNWENILFLTSGEIGMGRRGDKEVTDNYMETLTLCQDLDRSSEEDWNVLVALHAIEKR